MTTFTRTWDTNYKGSPPDTDDSSEGAGHIRNIKEDVYERMVVDHSWLGDANDGKHQKVTLLALSADPTLDTGEVALYAKPVGSKSQLFFRDQDGNAVQLTFSGQGQTLPSGVVLAFAGTVPPGGYLLCFGQTVSQSTYPGLFSAIGTTYGPAVGGNFTLPDLRGRTIFGLDNMGGTPAGRLTHGITGSTLGASGGTDQHTLVVAEMPSHSHSVSDPGHAHSYRTPESFGSGADNISQGGPFQFMWHDLGGSSASSTSGTGTGITLGSTGSGTAFNITNPGLVLNYLIKT